MTTIPTPYDAEIERLLSLPSNRRDRFSDELLRLAKAKRDGYLLAKEEDTNMARLGESAGLRSGEEGSTDASSST